MRIDDVVIPSVTVQIGRGTLYLSYFVCRAAQINRYAALSFMAASLTVGTLPLLYVPPTPSRPTHLRSSRYVAYSLTVVAQWFSVSSGGGECRVQSHVAGISMFVILNVRRLIDRSNRLIDTQIKHPGSKNL